MPRKLKGGGWSFKQERRVLELAAQSKSPEEIANLMSRSPEAIRKAAIRLGVSLSKNKQLGERLRALRASMSASGDG
jgi:hypothetical protein